MSHKRFAQINHDGLVTNVIVADSKEWCQNALGGTWVETFKDRSQRYNFAGKNYTYDSYRDAFIPPKPFESWVLEESTCLWVPPIPVPDDGYDYWWNEDLGDWVQVEA